MAVIQIGNGQTCFFWKDKWASQTLEEQFPLLKSSSLRLSHLQKNRFISVNKTFEEENFIDLFNLPLSQVAFEQTPEIQQVFGSTHLDDLTTDVWTYFGGSTKFRSVAAYKKNAWAY